MTLANFNSNFNWQLRMLKEAADCCGIIPPIPPPVSKCLWLGNADIGDSWIGFENPSASWSGEYYINGVNGQAAYQSDLGVFSYTDQLTPSTFFVWSLEDGGSAPTGWTYNGGTQQLNWTTSYCDTSKSCFETFGTFDTAASVLRCTYLTLSTGHTLDFSFTSGNIDDSSVTIYLQGIFGGQATITSNIDWGNGTYSIKIDNAYNAISPVQIELFDRASTFVSNFAACVPVARCPYTASFDPIAQGTGYSNFVGWTLNGNDLVTELTSLMTSSGGNVWLGFNNSAEFLFYGCWFYYYGTSNIGPLDFTAPDSSVYQVYFTRNEDLAFGCDYRCFEIPITGTGVKLDFATVAYTLTGYNPQLSSSAPFNANILSDDQIVLEQLFQLIYGPQCYVTVLTAGGNDTITIYDAFDFGVPIVTDISANQYTGSYITCP